jgi:hypothetical protein
MRSMKLAEFQSRFDPMRHVIRTWGQCAGRHSMAWGPARRAALVAVGRKGKLNAEELERHTARGIAP